MPDLGPYADESWDPKLKTLAAMIGRLDRDVGTLFALLKELDLDRKTLVLFASDNGAAYQDELFDHMGPLRGRKRDLYEGGGRTPAIIRWPDQVPAGVVSRQVWAFWDLLPTLAELTGQPNPPTADGISVLSAFRTNKPVDYPPLYFEFHERGFQQAARIGDWKGVRGRGRLPFVALQDAHGPEPWWFADMTTGFRTLFLAEAPTWENWLKALRNQWIAAVRRDAATNQTLRMHAGSDEVARVVLVQEARWRWWDNPAIVRPLVSVVVLRPGDRFEAGVPETGIAIRIRCAWTNTTQGVPKTPLAELKTVTVDGEVVEPEPLEATAARRGPMPADRAHLVRLSNLAAGEHLGRFTVREQTFPGPASSSRPSFDQGSRRLSLGGRASSREPISMRRLLTAEISFVLMGAAAASPRSSPPTRFCRAILRHPGERPSEVRCSCSGSRNPTLSKSVHRRSHRRCGTRKSAPNCPATDGPPSPQLPLVSQPHGDEVMKAVEPDLCSLLPRRPGRFLERARLPEDKRKILP